MDITMNVITGYLWNTPVSPLQEFVSLGPLYWQRQKVWPEVCDKMTKRSICCPFHSNIWPQELYEVLNICLKFWVWVYEVVDNTKSLRRNTRKHCVSINCNNLEGKVKLFEGQDDKMIKNKEWIRNESHLLKILILKQKIHTEMPG